MTSSPSLTSNNFIITHHLNTLHNNVGNYFEFICMKTSLTMFDNSDTFENFFLFRCYKLSSVNHQQTFSFMIINNNFQKLFHSWSTTTSSWSSTNFFIHDHQQTFSFMIINNNFMIINNNFMIINKLFHHQPKTFSFTPAKYIHSHHPTPPHGQHIHHRSTCPYNHHPNST